MKKVSIATAVFGILIISNIARSQEGLESENQQYSESSYEGSGSAESGVTRETRVAAPAVAAAVTHGSVRSYPSASLAIKLDLFSLPINDASVIRMTYPVLLEVSLDITWRFSVFFAMGTYLAYTKQEDDNGEDKLNEAALLMQGGGRINLMEPRPNHAHLFIPVDFTGAIGIASVEEDDEENEDEEDAIKERLDHLIIGTGIGIEYLVASEFGIGAEFGLRWLFNNLKDTNDNLDPNFAGQFLTAFALRIAYHF
ncbi:MAG: hypothetical protein GY847_16325 [Proteobacteria bacterium]|nr:hypothetical protein [Pseudomonadota bacterium]